MVLLEISRIPDRKIMFFAKFSFRDFCHKMLLDQKNAMAFCDKLKPFHIPKYLQCFVNPYKTAPKDLHF